MSSQDLEIHSFEFPQFTLEFWQSNQAGIYLVGKAGEERPIGKCKPENDTPQALQAEAQRIYAKLAATAERSKDREIESLTEQFRTSLLIAADTPEELRPLDVDRVLADADDRGYLEPFKQWLLSQPLQERTRQLVEA